PLERFALSPIILVLAAAPLERFALSPIILVLAAAPLERFALSPIILVLAAAPLERFALSPIILVLAAAPLEHERARAGRRLHSLRELGRGDPRPAVTDGDHVVARGEPQRGIARAKDLGELAQTRGGVVAQRQRDQAL